MEIIKSLRDCEFVEDFSVIQHKVFNGGFFLKIKVLLKDQSELFISEYSDAKERNYSYHWQKPNGELIVRWDNSPYHPDLFYFPHHKHIGDSVEPSVEITMDEVLKYISKIISR